MVSRCMTSTSFTKGARPIRASTRASGSAQPGWMYTRIPDSTQDTASCAVTSLLRYCSIQDIYPNPFLSSKPKPFPISRSSRRWHARAPARRSKWQDERTCPAFPTVPSRRKSLPDAPVHVDGTVGNAGQVLSSCHLLQFHLAENLCRMLQFSVFLQVVPKVLADQANHPYHLANRHALHHDLHHGNASFAVAPFGQALAEDSHQVHRQLRLLQRFL